MNKIRVIDILNKIANGEYMPKKIRILSNNEIFEYVSDDYIGENGDDLFKECLANTINISAFLRDEVELIEEEKKIPEKLDVDEEENGKYIIWNTEYEQCSTLEMKIIKRQDYIINKIKEIIDYLKSKGE